MSKVVVIVVIVVLISVIGFIFFSSKQAVPNSSLSESSSSQQAIETSVTPSTNIQASFAIFTNGTFRVFNAVMYHNLSQDAYIESNNPNIVQVKKSGTTWNDFFATLPLKLTSTCLTTGIKETFCTGRKGTLQF